MSETRIRLLNSGEIVMPVYNKSGEGNPMYGKTHKDSSKKITSEKAKKRMLDPNNRPIGEKNGMFGKTLGQEARKGYPSQHRRKDGIQMEKITFIYTLAMHHQLDLDQAEQ